MRKRVENGEAPLQDAEDANAATGVTRVAVFDGLARRYVPLIWWYRMRRFDTLYVAPIRLDDADGSLGLPRTVARLVRYLPLTEYPDVAITSLTSRALELTELVYARYRRSQPWLIRRLRALYRSEDVDLAFQKQLLIELNDYLRLCEMRERIKAALPAVEHPIFVPRRSVDVGRASSCESELRLSGIDTRGAHEAVRFGAWTLAVGRLRLAMSLLRSLLQVAQLMLFLARWSLRRAPAPSRSSHPYAIAIVSPSREFANDLRGPTFLLDGRTVCADNTLMVPLVPITDARRRALLACGFQVAEEEATRPPEAAAVFLCGAGALAVGAFAPRWMTIVAAVLIREYVKWASFLERYSVRHFISYADFETRHIPRNILLRRSGAQTWYYLDSENLGALIHPNPGSTMRRELLWAYLCYDKVLTWSERTLRFHQAHPQKVGEYRAIGCLWSEHIRMLRSGEIVSALPKRLARAGHREGQKIVSVFDSSYSNSARTTYRDGADFAEGIEQLLEELPGVFIVWKEKKPAWLPWPHGHAGVNTFGLTAIYERLARHPRCYFAGHETSSAEVAAVSDLTISFPFTSTTLEALGARQRAIYFDPTGKYAGNSYERVPGLVVAGYEELRRRAEELLYDLSAADFERYLERHVKGEIEPYLDGRAISRFRDLLRGDSS